MFRPSTRPSTLPLPNQVALLDCAVLLFGLIFPAITLPKHRCQLLEHFNTCIKTTKAGTRKQALHTNIFAAFISALKETAARKERNGFLMKDITVKAARELALSTITNEDPVLRCAAGEVLVRLTVLVGDTFKPSLL